MSTATIPAKNLYTACNEWASRPPEQRYWGLNDLYPYLKTRREQSREVMTPAGMLRCVALPGGLSLHNPSKLRDGMVPPLLNHYSFGQVSALVNAPADYLRTLPPEKAAELVNYGLAKRTEWPSGGELNMFCSVNGTLKIRAVTSNRYARLYDDEIIAKLMPLQAKGWKVPPARPVCTDETSPAYDTRTRPALESDCLVNRMPGLGIQPGNLIAPAGAYASDRDMFVFMVDDSRSPDTGLQRGFFIKNSEVGCARFTLTMFLLNEVCGNHIVWGASGVKEVSFVHKGDSRDMSSKSFYALEQGVKAFEQLPDGTIMERITAAKKWELGTDLESILCTLSSKRALKFLSEKQVEAGLATFREHPEDSGKRLLTSEKVSAWDLTQGLTRNAQNPGYAAERTELEEKAGKLLDMIAL